LLSYILFRQKQLKSITAFLFFYKIFSGLSINAHEQFILNQFINTNSIAIVSLTYKPYTPVGFETGFNISQEDVMTTK
jgi:hypothetical protein